MKITHCPNCNKSEPFKMLSKNKYSCNACAMIFKISIKITYDQDNGNYRKSIRGEL